MQENEQKKQIVEDTEGTSSDTASVKENVEVTKEDSNSENLMSVVAYFIFFIPLLLPEYKNNQTVKFHVKQSILLIGSSIALSIVRSILAGMMRYSLFSPISFVFSLANMGLFVLWIIGVINAFKGEKKELPFIGQYAEKYLKF